MCCCQISVHGESIPSFSKMDDLQTETNGKALIYLWMNVHSSVFQTGCLVSGLRQLCGAICFRCSAERYEVFQGFPLQLVQKCQIRSWQAMPRNRDIPVPAGHLTL